MGVISTRKAQASCAISWWRAACPLSGAGQSNPTTRSSRVASLKGIVDLRTLSDITFKEAVVENALLCLAADLMNSISDEAP